jgi:wobble nucleotide-excising tRNase|uniref:AAA family ATPase n=1 Tax=uncultured Acidovorax sp. TaxID=158751 RepID=UPI0025F9FF85|nr:AAA family ATPase [uncultured Acidovorax sp.]
MLNKIITLDNLGVFRHGTPKAADFDRVTLLYAENGRGKSSISAALASLSTGDVGPLIARCTFGGGAQKVVVRCTTGGTSANVQFDGAKWSASVPDIVVFDQHFIERNVYAGSEVQTSHHEALLEFALGTAAVKKKQEVDAAGDDQTAATKRRTTAEDKLKGYMGATPLPVFLKLLVKDDKVDETIAGLENRIAAAKDAGAIAARASLAPLAVPSFDFAKFKAVLGRSLQDIHADAEAAVKAHVAHLESVPETETEEWLATGLRLMDGHNCPFCSQPTDGVPLIAAYRTYFNEAYAELTAEVRDLAATADASVSQDGLASYEQVDATNRERINGWSGQLKLQLTALNIEPARQTVASAMKNVEALVLLKKLTPLQSVDFAALADVEAELNAAFQVVAAYNVEVATANEAITAYKAGLAAEKLDVLQASLASAKLNKTRFSPEVVALVDERQLADADRTQAETSKKTAREELDALMATVLDKFQKSINTWLAKFGADFTVVKLKPTYVGSSGTPRTEYGLSVRGQTVPAGKKAATPCFQTALSDGDKRTLALAFFLAKLFDDTDHGKKVVVVDDLFTSLDKHRRAQTVDAITQLARSVEQLIVLAHDAFFLRDVFRRLTGKGICTPALLEAVRAADGYSEIRNGFDMDEACATDFYKHYRALDDFLAAKPSEKPLAVAIGLRPLLEGHLHRRFPGRIAEGVTVGSVLQLIKDAPADSPLVVLQGSLTGLHELNDFAGAFHHDTSGIAPRTDVTDAELKAYGERTMQLLHTGYL